MQILDVIQVVREKWKIRLKFMSRLFPYRNNSVFLTCLHFEFLNETVDKITILPQANPFDWKQRKNYQQHSEKHTKLIFSTTLGHADFIPLSAVEIVIQYPECGEKLKFRKVSHRN